MSRKVTRSQHMIIRSGKGAITLMYGKIVYWQSSAWQNVENSIPPTVNHKLTHTHKKGTKIQFLFSWGKSVRQNSTKIYLHFTLIPSYTEWVYLKTECKKPTISEFHVNTQSIVCLYTLLSKGSSTESNISGHIRGEVTK